MIEKFKSDWKRYSIYAGVILFSLLLGLVIGMSLTDVDTIKQILINTISGIINNLPWFILIFVSVKLFSEAIRKAAGRILKQAPEWLENYERTRMKILRVEKAVASR